MDYEPNLSDASLSRVASGLLRAAIAWGVFVLLDRIGLPGVGAFVAVLLLA